MDSKVDYIGSDLFIVTENIRGDIYEIRCKYIQDLIDDWYGDCGMCPPEDNRVFFASWNSVPFNPYDCINFGCLILILEEMIK